MLRKKDYRLDFASASMRAFASILLVAALLFPTVLFLSMQSRASLESEGFLEVARAAEKNYYAGEDILNAALASMRNVARERMPRDARSVRETQESIGERLAELEKFAEAEYGAKGVAVDLWCGFFSVKERAELSQKMAGEGRVLKCERCFDASRTVVLVGRDGRMKPVAVCAFFSAVEPSLTGGGRAGVGNSFLNMLVDEEGDVIVPFGIDVWDVAAGGEPALGVSVYDSRTGAASVSYIMGGEAVEY